MGSLYICTIAHHSLPGVVIKTDGAPFFDACFGNAVVKLYVRIPRKYKNLSFPLVVGQNAESFRK